MKTPNNSEIQAEVFTLLLKELEPWKVAHFWASCKLGTGDYLKEKYAQPETETIEDLIQEITAYQNKKGDRH
jgi:hypothetical protein